MKKQKHNIGEKVVLTLEGPNNSGKTTFLRSILAKPKGVPNFTFRHLGPHKIEMRFIFESKLFREKMMTIIREEE